MSWLLYLILALCAIGMFIGLSKQKQGYGWGQPVAIICIIIGICAAGVKIYGTSFGGANTSQQNKNALLWQQLSAQVLGKYLATHYAGSKCLVILKPTLTNDKSEQDAYLNGLKLGFGGKLTIAATFVPTIPESAKKAAAPAPPNAANQAPELPPQEYWFTPTVFDNAVKDNLSKINMVISTLGLPAGLGSLQFWSLQNRPALALMNGSVYHLKKAIEQKWIAAAVTFNPNAQYGTGAPGGNIEKEFNTRYILVTPESIDKLVKEFPSMFKE